ncbi:GNAT family N-acetyltransferase [Nocardia thailandica]|uniref:GNAT family N-acetyltransferase n=1 Tax=Nocardia thailandica TaxID=257275 RepID=A0ABW6PL52_9NOCA
MTSAIRVAGAGDVGDLNALDALCFPAGDVDREPASEDELADGVRNNQVIIATSNEVLVGFLHFERPNPGHVYISALAVHPSCRRRGIARSLLRRLMADLSADDRRSLPSISTVTSPRNYSMLRLLLREGFVARTLMAGYFGPGHDRLYLQYKLRIDYVDPDERYLVPVRAMRHVEQLLSDDNYVISDFVDLPSGPAFEFCRFERDDLAGLEADETAISVTFAGTVLAAITFVLGTALGSDRYPDPAKTLLLLAVLATTVALVVYTNAAGDVARLRSHAFDLHMRVGNVISEFGGVYPFLVSLPITFAVVTDSLYLGLAAAAIFAAVLTAYENPLFSISRRFAQSRTTHLLRAITVTAPVSGVLCMRHAVLSWVWTGVVLATFVALAVLFLLRRRRESLVGHDGVGRDTRP